MKRYNSVYNKGMKQAILVEDKEGELVKFEDVRKLQKEVFSFKFNMDTLLNFTRDLLTHEQHIKFAAKKKEVFGS